MDSEKEMTHDEIWDDRALVASWNDALEEYQKYHSIRARGGTLEDVLALEEEERKKNGSSPDAKTETNCAEQPMGDAPADQTLEPGAETTTGVEGTGADRGQAAAALGPKAAGLSPPNILGSVQDEDLKKVLMSWYYAGYYTGIYEAKHQKQQQQQGGSEGEREQEQGHQEQQEQ